MCFHFRFEARINLGVKIYQHRSPQVEFVEELSDENVGFKKLSGIEVFNVFENVNEPLVVTMTGTDPEEVDLK